MSNFPFQNAKIIDPVRLRAEEVENEQTKRVEEIADKIIEVLIKEKVALSEINSIIAVLTSKINKKWDNAEIEKIMNL